MCGIAGFTRDPIQPAGSDQAIVIRMLERIAHRGPDDEGTHVAGSIAFGHLRLAVVDLVGGHQPRVDEISGDALLFNGEIYGFTELAAQLSAAGANLADRSDTEVLFQLLQRVGLDAALDKIDGMFAFAFFHARTATLHLVRDRFGEKPLYWCVRGAVLIFGSEPSAILAHPLAHSLHVDLGSVHKFLTYEYLPGTCGFHSGLHKLSPGHVLTWRDGKVSIRAYWRPEPDETGYERRRESETDKLERLDQLLDTTVRDRLVADVPIGVFLSGGIDSSLIAALVGKHAPALTAFTMRMSEASFDETAAAKRLAESLGLAHQVIDLDDAAVLHALEAVSAKLDEPFADSSILPTWVLCRAARQQVTVALGGDGADELFAGYISFQANRAASALRLVPGWIGRLARAALAALPDSSSYMSLPFLLRQVSQAAGLPPVRQWIACMAPFAPEELDRLWRADARSAAEAAAEDPLTDYIAERGSEPWSTAELIRLFAQTYLPEDILFKVDRASMYVSLEVRTPFLGRAFAEYAMSLPSNDKIKGLSTKHLFRKLALRHIPRDIVERKKHGFAVPMADLLRGCLREPIGAGLLDHGSPLHQWFDRAEIERLWRAHQAGSNHRKKIWTLFTLATAARNHAAAFR